MTKRPKALAVLYGNAGERDVWGVVRYQGDDDQFYALAETVLRYETDALDEGFEIAPPEPGLFRWECWGGPDAEFPQYCQPQQVPGRGVWRGAEIRLRRRATEEAQP